MTEKYYTPAIEEFRVGFEYEQKSGDEWKKRTFDQIYENYEFPIPDEGDISEMGNFRVKCLDKEDIESLEWTLKELQYIKGEYQLKFFDGTPQIQIVFNNRLGVYYGDCKNKSELKFLMKRLGI